MPRSACDAGPVAADLASASGPRATRLLAPLAALALLGATLAAYLPAIRGGLLWDDAAHITAPRLRSWHGLRDIWFRLGATQQYYPVLHSAFWLEHRLWGDSVLGYHLLSVVLHAASACLFAQVLARLSPGGRGWDGAEWLAAAVFALHPVCVESVAWISEQKNTLSLVLYLLSALAYLRFDRARAGRWYLLAFALFALALLSKSVTATLPAALLLAVVFRRRAFSFRRDALPLLPWFAAGVSSGLFTAWVEREFVGARGPAFDLGLAQRCLLAGRVVWFYLGKLVWPRNLIFIYPRWHVELGWPWVAGVAALAALLGACWAVRRWSAAPLAGFLFYVGSLFPALGFFNVYPFLFSYVADHFQYLASLGVIAVAAVGGAELSRESRRPAARSAFWFVAACVLGLLFTLTRDQAGHYSDAVTLYEDTLAKNPGCWMADNNLGVCLIDRGPLQGAIARLRRAIELKPDYADAHNNLGNALSRLPGGSAEAVAEFEAALGLDPGMAEAHANLGLALVAVPGREAEGIAHLRAALREGYDDPQFADLHAALGSALVRQPGNEAEGFRELAAALRLKPDSADTMEKLGLALARAGRPGEAEAHLQGAVRLVPASAEYRNNLGGVLALLGRGPEAIVQFREAVRLDPKSAGAHLNLGRALRVAGDTDEAIEEHREAIRIDPASAEIRSSLGSIFYRLGRTREALVEYREAARLEPLSSRYRYNLGLALSEAGMLDDAIRELGRAVRIEPGYADAHYALAVALRKAGRETEAEREFEASGRRP